MGFDSYSPFTFSGFTKLILKVISLHKDLITALQKIVFSFAKIWETEDWAIRNGYLPSSPIFIHQCLPEHRQHLLPHLT